MAVHFIDHSESCIFAENAHGGCFSVRYHDGSCHVVGGIELRYDTASDDPHEYWRREAHRAARGIVEQTGGYAIDRNGEISLIVPIHAAWAANRAMRAVRGLTCPGYYIQEDERNETALILGGAARFGSRFDHMSGFESAPSRGHLKLTAVAVPDTPHYTSHELVKVHGVGVGRVRLVWELRSPCKEDITVEAVTVPADWLDVTGSDLPLTEDWIKVVKQETWAQRQAAKIADD